MKQLPHFKRHTSQVTRHTSHVTRHTLLLQAASASARPPLFHRRIKAARDTANGDLLLLLLLLLQCSITKSAAMLFQGREGQHHE